MEIRQPHQPYHTDHCMVLSCQYHVLFCLNYRRKVLNEPLAARMKDLLLAKQAEYGSTVIEREVLPDHVHLLWDADPREGMLGMVANIKGSPSHERRNEFPWLKQRLPTRWTRSTCISTVGAVTWDLVTQSIEAQQSV